MICTFGDLTDVIWWRTSRCRPARSSEATDGSGRRRSERGLGVSLDPERANASYAEIEGLTVKQAQAASSSCSRDSGDLLGEPRPITHAVKFYERGERPLEIVTSRQWYVRPSSAAKRSWPGTRARLAPRVHAGPLRGLGGRPHRRLEHLAAALLRRPVPGLVPLDDEGDRR